MAKVLFLLYQLLYKERNDYQGKYKRLKGFVKKYREFQQLPKEKQQKITSEEGAFLGFPYFFMVPHLKKVDPLLSFLEELEGLDLSDKTKLFF